MSNLNTKLMQALVEKRSIEEVFRQSLEETVNQLLQAEISGYLGYENTTQMAGILAISAMVFILVNCRRNMER